jgi:hypothetical protein
MAVVDQVTRLRPGTRKSHPVDYIINPTFQQLQEDLSSDTLAPVSLSKIAAKLAFLDPIDPLCFLFFP